MASLPVNNREKIHVLTRVHNTSNKVVFQNKKKIYLFNLFIYKILFKFRKNYPIT